MIACPNCQGDKSKTIDSRNTPDGGRRRRMECPCGMRFTTGELIVSSDYWFRGKSATEAVAFQVRDCDSLANYTERELLSELLNRNIQKGAHHDLP